MGAQVPVEDFKYLCSCEIIYRATHLTYLVELHLDHLYNSD